jgi:hypothetical protein
MDNFSFFKIGWDHIISLDAVDHFLFIITLCATYRVAQWRKVVLMISAFTIGHCATLLLSAFDFIPLSGKIDIFIPFTILITSLSNIFLNNKAISSYGNLSKILITVVFGMIHGLAFAGNFKAMLFSADNIVLPLFLFNIGIEIGQILIIAIYFTILLVINKTLIKHHYTWNTFISGIGFGVSIYLIINILRA